MQLVHVTASLGIGGAESVLTTLASELQKKGIRQTVITFREGPFVGQLRAVGIPVLVVRGLFTRYDPLFWFRLICMIKKLRPDCLHSLLWVSNIAVRIIGWIFCIPVVSGMHNNTVLYSRFNNILDRLTLPLAQQVVAIHEGVKQSIITRCPQHERLPLSVIYNCIDYEKVHRLAAADSHAREEFGFDSSHFVIGGVGRLIPIKRYALLIQAFAQLYETMPHARLVIVGYGQDEERLRLLINKLHLEEVVVLVVGKQAYGYFPLFNCFVLPSLTEGPAIALLEAMSFRLPCIVTHDAPQHPVIVDCVNGLLLSKPEDSLRDAILLLIENKMLCKQYGERAWNTVRDQFSAPVMAAAYEKVFAEARQNKGKL